MPSCRRPSFTVDFGLELVRNHVVGGAHQAQQQPKDQQVDVNGAGHVERDDIQQRVVAPNVLRDVQNSKRRLEQEEQ